MLSPMMQQYMDLKSQHKDCILFFRLGDFYEMFFEDAQLASKELELTLTGRDCGTEDRAPMCGVPYSSVDVYISKLVERGYKVAIAEQVEDPKKVKTLVKREVIRIVTKGNIMDGNILDEDRNNYIVGVFQSAKGADGKSDFSIAIVEATTGEFLTMYLENVEQRKVVDELAKFNPAQIIINSDCELEKVFFDTFNIKSEKYFDGAFDYENAYMKLCNHFSTLNLSGFGFGDAKSDKLCIRVSGALLEYLDQLQKSFQGQITSIRKYFNDDYMMIDASSRKNLELICSSNDGKKKGSLVWVLDKTKTSMGARLLKKWLGQPLVNVEKINRRLDFVEEFVNDGILREEIKELLDTIYDMERLLSRVIMNIANAKDLLCLGKSLRYLPDIKSIIGTLHSSCARGIFERFDAMEDLQNLIENSLMDEVPLSLHEGGFIKDGFDERLDQLRMIRNNSAKIISELEEKERRISGIKNLRIKNNKVFGYYIEVTNSNRDSVPGYYIRKQTLVNCERFFTTELKEIEEKIIGAQEKINDLEYEIFVDITKKVAGEVSRVQNTAYLISVIDVLVSFADVSDKNNYVRPQVKADGEIKIKNGRHPVVEKIIGQSFIPNDTTLNLTDENLVVITGPNMAGKSTYMRQVALIVLMAQVGCFVPASEAQIGVVDKIFTRVGASDDLATGQSTFMVEMNEVANILNSATKNSLVIIDEVGRGTGTYDGLSIAWAVIEYIRQQLGCKTLFATHYHELTELEGKIPGVKNYCAAVQEDGDEVIFLKKIIRGGADHSYGIYVAKLAGVPSVILKRAQDIFSLLDENNIQKTNSAEQNEIFYADKKPFDYDKNKIIIKELKAIDVKKMSVRDILRTITELQNRI